jgi:3-oxoacyl-[acyl-carrier protein] reductase
MGSRFAGKVVVITGGGAGIGRTYAQRFASEGASIVIADIDAQAAERVVGEVRSTGGQALGFTMNVTDQDAAEAMAAAASDTFGGIDVLINNAAIHLEHAQLPYTMEAVARWREVLDVNVIGPLACTIACRPAMVAKHGGAVLNQSSMAAYGGGGAYGVSKLGLNALTVSLAAELAPDGIRVNGIAPGLVDSESAVVWMNDPVRAGIKDTLIGGQLIKRLGSMEDLAKAALFLCSDDAGFITGQTVLVDGGYTKKPF